jgi:hypothetical protein
MGTSSGPQTSTSTVKLPEWMDTAGQNLWKQAQDIAARPYQAYTGQRVSQFTPAEIDAQNRALAFSRSNVGGAALDQSMGATRAGTEYNAKSILDMGLEKYMNPYLQNVSDRAMSDIQRQQTMQQQQNAQAAASAGAFGGSRHGVAEAETARNYGDIYANQMATMYSNAFDNAAGLAQGDITNAYNAQNMRLNAANQLANMAATQRQFGLQDIDVANQVGREQRKLDQAQQDFNYQQWQEEQNYPMRQLAIQQGTLFGMPHGSTTTTTSTGGSGGSNPLMGAAGGAMAGSAFGPWGTAIGAGVGLLGSLF